MTPHNHAKPGDYAEAVLLPGDPLRAKWIAETFFEGARQVNSVRNCLGFTGTWKGKPVSVQATGMGQPSLSIYVHELINVYGVQKLIRVGTAGGLNARVKVRDLIIAQGASTDSGIVKDGFAPFAFAPLADFGLLRDSVERAEKAGLRYHVGNMLSSDIFYHVEPGLAGYGRLPAHGILGVEMEAAALYTLAARFDRRALAICTMTDCLITHAELSAADRQSSLKEMITLALDVATGGMSVLGRLASALGRNDERPNIALAEALAARPDAAVVAELVEALATGTAAQKSDAIKVLYELGDRRPEAVAGHVQSFIELLGSRSNRLVWGAMHAVASVTPLRPDAVLAALPRVIAAADRGSVIAKDHAMSTLARLVAAGHGVTILPILLDRLEGAATNQFPMYAEFAAAVVDAAYRERFRQILRTRLPGLPPAKQARIGKVLRKLD